MNEIEITVKCTDYKSLYWFGKIYIRFFFYFGLFYGLLTILHIAKPSVLLGICWFIGLICWTCGKFNKKQNIRLRREEEQVFINQDIYDIHNICCLKQGYTFRFHTRPYSCSQDIETEFICQKKDIPQLEAFIQDCLQIPINVAVHDSAP